MSISSQAIAEVLLHVARLTNGTAFSEGLNPAQWAALRFLAAAPEGARTLMGFARYHGTTKGTASQTLGALKRKALIESAPDRLDARSSQLKLSRKGTELLAKDPVQGLSSAITGLSSELQASLAEALERIAKSIVAMAN